MYAISFEGEELGSNKSLITGKKAQMPFDIILQGTRNFANESSWMLTHLRCDFIVYVRPDLVVSILGR
ncbi:hypothetical protein KDA23_05565 [Candidatus Saccharibacteria bacterium]|nr:hypothetical protein [Candidatus Saccharibacteria bacterium]